METFPCLVKSEQDANVTSLNTTAKHIHVILLGMCRPTKKFWGKPVTTAKYRFVLIGGRRGHSLVTVSSDTVVSPSFWLKEFSERAPEPSVHVQVHTGSTCMLRYVYEHVAMSVYNGNKKQQLSVCQCFINASISGLKSNLQNSFLYKVKLRVHDSPLVHGLNQSCTSHAQVPVP